ncbi:hypothetical protein PV10_00601 [Exophiala mesophila]|uniref:DUF1917 domain-containing protein n=1 Tax=Exophiala mesophila TaxID=212818 RepID=A0A0D2ACW2_EXOME|nr:uncharacterized protein PV10_00601 [Exophiala mesophila]KIV96783.1 hypothetical protein PV10_00601 [Exophiala mesophila]
MNEDDSLVAIPDDLFSDESDFVGNANVKSRYTTYAAAYDPKRHWDINQWNIQVLAAYSKEDQGIVPRKRGREPDDQGMLVASPPAKFAKLNSQGIPNTINTRQTRDMAIKYSSGRETSPMCLDTPTTSPVASQAEPKKQQNYYEGIPTAKQLSETVAAFLKRLDPVTTQRTNGSWIWIANPYPAPSPSHNQTDTGDVAAFKQAGFDILDAYRQRVEEVQTSNSSRAAGAITRMLRPHRLQLEQDLIRVAKEHHVLHGKWMLFPETSDVGRVWAIVAHATWDGKLGVSAKVAIEDGGNARNELQMRRLICIYTHDFSDQDDVRRVVQNMKTLGLLRDEGSNGGFMGTKTIYYKCDAYTYLDIDGGNEFKLKPSMYNSRDMLN